MNNLNNNPVNNLNGIKTEAGLSPTRLSSFKPPRDLTLGASKQNAKRVFIPNLNAVRNKNKSAACGAGESTGRAPRGARVLRGRTPRPGPNILKATGVFSEGVASSGRSSSRGSYVSRDHDGATVPKPTLRLKHEYKLDKEMEDLQIKELTKDAEAGDFAVNGPFVPTRLPVTSQGSLIMNVKPPVKPLTSAESAHYLIIKEEEAKKPFQIKTEHFKSSEAVNILQGDEPMLLLMQFPDTLPGRGPDIESQETENLCTSRHLQEGQIGKILMYKSGKVKMLMGSMHYDLAVGTQPCFRQDTVSVSSDPEQRSGSMVVLGPLGHKLTATPDWEVMFQHIDN